MDSPCSFNTMVVNLFGTNNVVMFNKLIKTSKQAI